MYSVGVEQEWKVLQKVLTIPPLSHRSRNVQMGLALSLSVMVAPQIVVVQIFLPPIKLNEPHDFGICQVRHVCCDFASYNVIGCNTACDAAATPQLRLHTENILGITHTKAIKLKDRKRRVF